MIRQEREYPGSFFSKLYISLFLVGGNIYLLRVISREFLLVQRFVKKYTPFVVSVSNHKYPSTRSGRAEKILYNYFRNAVLDIDGIVSEDTIGLGLVFLFWCLWNGLAGYMLVNTPYRIVIRPENMLVFWRKKYPKHYQWNEIAVKKIGVIVYDPAWRWLGRRLPRVMIFGLSPKKYNEFLNTIQAFKREAALKKHTSPYSSD